MVEMSGRRFKGVEDDAIDTIVVPRLFIPSRRVISLLIPKAIIVENEKDKGRGNSDAAFVLLEILLRRFNCGRRIGESSTRSTRKSFIRNEAETASLEMARVICRCSDMREIDHRISRSRKFSLPCVSLSLSLSLSLFLDLDKLARCPRRIDISESCV